LFAAVPFVVLSVVSVCVNVNVDVDVGLLLAEHDLGIVRVLNPSVGVSFRRAIIQLPKQLTNAICGSLKAYQSTPELPTIYN